MNSKRNIIFLSFTFALTWSCWWFLAYLTHTGVIEFGQSYSFILFVLGGSAPTIGAYFAVMKTKEVGDLKEFNSRLFKFRVEYQWHFIALLFPVIIGVMGILIGYLYNNNFFNEQSFQPFYIFIPAFLSAIFFGGIEEFGWRGVLLPELLKKHGYIFSTVTVGIIWGVWHLPLFYILGTTQYEMFFPIFLFLSIGLSAIFTWLYVKTNSIFLCVIFHASFNATVGIGLFIPNNQIVAYLTYTIMLMLIGLLLVVRLPKKVV